MTQLWVPSSSPLFLYSPSNLVSETLQGQWVGSLAPDQPAGAINQSLWTATASAAILFPSIYCRFIYWHKAERQVQVSHQSLMPNQAGRLHLVSIPKHPSHGLRDKCGLERNSIQTLSCCNSNVLLETARRPPSASGAVPS